MATSRVEGHNYGEKVRVVKLNDDVIDLCAGTHVKNTKEIEELKLIKFETKGSGVYRIEAIAGKESIQRVFSKINSDMKEEIINPLINKVKNINGKLKEINLKQEINFDNEINNLDIKNSNFKNQVKVLTNDIRETILNTNKNINKELINLFNEKLNSEIIFIEEFKTFDIQELTKPMLNVINNKKAELAIIITTKKDKVTYAFLIPKRNISEKLVLKIKNICEKFNLRGNGKNQLFIFGGQKFDNSEMIKEIKT